MKYLIIEDEEFARKRLISQLQEIDNEMEIIGEAESVEEGIEFLRKGEAMDLIITDVQLADGLCFDIFKIAPPLCPVIFTTAYNEYALEAFKVYALDYLLKPVKKADLEKAIAKSSKFLFKQTEPIDYQKLALAIKEGEKKFQKRFLIKIGTKFITLPTENAACFFSEHKSTIAATFEGKTYPLDFPLDKLTDLLDPAEFFRINRQIIINRRAITQMVQYSKGRVRISLAVDLPEKIDAIVSTERSPHFKTWLEE